MLPEKPIIEATVETTIEQLKPHMLQIGRLLSEELDEVVSMEATMPVKHQRLQALIEQAAALVGPVTPCKSGCSHCCHMAVTVSSHEADLIAKHLGIHRAHPPMVLDQMHEVDTYMNVPCVFLKKHRCTIYEVRPIACRTHFNLSAYPEVCDTINHPGHDVPNLDWRPVWMASAILHGEAGCTFADLREFFPHGGHDVQSL